MVAPPRPTIADGIAVGRPGKLTFPIIQRLVDDVVTVGEEETAHAMLLLLERAKLVVEGAGAVGLAALLSHKLPVPGKKVTVVLSGGNIDSNLLTRTLQHGLAHAGRYLVLRVTVADRPGRLAQLLQALAQEGANVLDVVHHRYAPHAPPGEVQIEVTVETRDTTHGAAIVSALRQGGYRPTTPGVLDEQGPVELISQEVQGETP